MKFGFLLILLTAFNTSFSQDTFWKTFRVDSNLTLEFKGAVDTGTKVTIDKYSYDVYSGNTGKAIYIVMRGVSKEKIEVYDREEYHKTLDLMVEGAVKAAGEMNLNTILTDTSIDNVPGKRMSYRGKFAGRDARGYNYFFLVNGLSYSINTIFLTPDLSEGDSADLSHFLSSINFNNNIRELKFANKKEFIAYHAGRFIGLLIVFVVIILVVIFFVRRI